MRLETQKARVMKYRLQVARAKAERESENERAKLERAAQEL